MPTLHIVHRFDRETLDRLSRIVETLAGDGSNKILAAIKRMDLNMAQRLESLRAELAAYFAAVDAYMVSVDEAVATAVAADDADEDTAIANLQSDIAAARAKLPAAPVVEPPVEPPPVEE